MPRVIATGTMQTMGARMIVFAEVRGCAITMFGGAGKSACMYANGGLKLKVRHEGNLFCS